MILAIYLRAQSWRMLQVDIKSLGFGTLKTVVKIIDHADFSYH